MFDHPGGMEAKSTVEADLALTSLLRFMLLRNGQHYTNSPHDACRYAQKVATVGIHIFITRHLITST